MRFLINWFIYALAIGIVAYILPGIQLNGIFAALVTAAILGLVNGFLRPVLFILTLPLTILTLGLFTFVLNALMVLLAAAMVPGFYVAGFWWAVLFTLAMSIVLFFLGELTEPKERTVRYVRFGPEVRRERDVN
ncbi:MAG: phage holin family protein [bacterium]|nr:phage holin family protein [bacterium]MDT8367517.1 phage holin family protein [bacterium]